jgi:two-component system KDP operon response regulator KdpE
VSPARPRILVVDDERALRESLAAELSDAGFEVLEAADGAEAERVVAAFPVDLVLTDLAMPIRDGFELIRALRASGDLPILVLSVRGADRDKIRALDLGADDYVTKPFSLGELLARIRAQLRRRGVVPLRRLEFSGLSIDLDRRSVEGPSGPIHLTPTELAILELLAGSAGRPVSISRIVEVVWQGAPGTSADTVRVHVGSLRRKIEPDPANPRFLVTEPWVGYRFVAEPLGE